MQKTFSNKNNSSKFFGRSLNLNVKKEMLDKYFCLKENIFSETKFDIKQYLDIAKNNYLLKLKNKKEKNLSKISTDNLTKQNNFGSQSLGMNLSVSNNKASKLNFPSLSMNLSNYSNSNIYKPKTKYIGMNTNYNLRTYKISNPKIKARYNISSRGNEENFFNVFKTIKKIKSKEKNFDFQLYLNKTKNNVDKKNALIALDSDKVLKNFNKKNKLKEKEDIPISTFITQRKEISINNLLIKLINNETNQLQKNEQKMTKELKKDINILETEEKKLDEYTNMQKIECKEIESTLVELITKHENLTKEEQDLMLDIKVKEFEIYKLLIDINLYRYFAKFTNTILEGDPSRFQMPLLPDIHEFDKIDLLPIIDEIIKNYSDVKIDKIPRLERRYSNISNANDNTRKKSINLIKYKEEGYFLYNPEFLYHKYNEIEGNILRLLTIKESLIVKKLNKEKQNNEALSYLIDRSKDLQNEYDSLCNFYNSETKKYENDLKDKGNSHIDIDLNETNKIIKDLYLFAIDVLENPLLKICKVNKRNFEKTNINYNDKINFEELVKYGRNLIGNLEINLDILLRELRNERKEDRQTFEKVIKDIKIYYKMKRQNLFEKNLVNENKLKKLEILEKQNEIKIIPKRDEPPYYRKRVRKQEIDYDAIRKEEDKELLNYH